jgi:hypothetical protein
MSVAKGLLLHHFDSEDEEEELTQDINRQLKFTSTKRTLQLLFTKFKQKVV